ncbi:MAG: response regulator transcription factor [Steroidobacteraceae bacterium]
MRRGSEVISVGADACHPGVAPVVFIIDDDPSVREPLEALIQRVGWQPMSFASANAFLAHPRSPVPSCLVLDVALPDLSGLELQRLLANRTELPIIFITGLLDVPTTVQAMKAGAVDFLTKPFSKEALLMAVEQALEHSSTALSEEAQTQVLRARYASLSPRESEVMALVVADLPNKVIGRELCIAEITVKAHRGKVMRKMDARSLLELVRMAARLGLTSGKSWPKSRTLGQSKCPLPPWLPPRSEERI